MYQDNLANWKLVLPAPAKNMKHSAHERKTLLSDVWFKAEDDAPVVQEALNLAKAEMFNSILGPKVEFQLCVCVGVLVPFFLQCHT